MSEIRVEAPVGPEIRAAEGARIMGHEAIGMVEDIGSGARRIRVGDLVVMPFAFSDGVPEGYRAMDERESLKVMVRP
jgi:threonine dehydrogenase-like Zn-dependent dehydrogenase